MTAQHGESQRKCCKRMGINEKQCNSLAGRFPLWIPVSRVIENLPLGPGNAWLIGSADSGVSAEPECSSHAPYLQCK